MRTTSWLTALGTALASLVPLTAALADNPPVPVWTKDELKTLYARSDAAGRMETMEAQDREMALTMGSAYRVLPSANETTDGYARRVLKKIEPGHPDVKAGQWALALARRFYLDTGKRADMLSRIEANKADRHILETRAAQSKVAVEQIGGMLVTKVETGGLIAPVPTGSGETPASFGCEAFVRGEKIEVHQLDRMTFAGHVPPPDAPRTARGGLRELVASMKDFNMRAQTMGIVDPMMKASHKKLRLFIPAGHPSIYLNELIRAADEGGMAVVFFMVLDKADGKMRQIPLLLTPPKQPAKAPKPRKGAPVKPAPVTVRCEDGERMQACANKLTDAFATGAAVVYPAP